MKTKSIPFLLAFLLLVGCAGMTMTSPQTVKEGMVVVAEQTASAMDTANRLYEQGSISEEQHEDVLKEALEVQAALDNTRALLESGDIPSAEAQLSFARQTLVRVRDRLKEHQDE